ncbi:MAG: sodium-dependent transporter [Halieaceae bacterium]|jgi:NSS family neurotransmitter:Na+ symporter|nr:sodium-dependent transporter [Halieaceae bacterium]
MASARGEFSSRFGFIMAAAGSAVGLGNIWGFPTQAASNGGAAFLIVYLVLAFVLAYPALMAEIILGRHARANAVTALGGVSENPIAAQLGRSAGFAGLVVASLILSFYVIVAGWMLAHCMGSLLAIVGLDAAEDWLTAFGASRNTLFMLVFMGLTIAIISAGVRDGIERWSSRLMPLLLITLIALVVYVLTLDGASEGLRVYLQPDFASALSPELIINALGSAFFSLSLGVGTMLIYGSYIREDENLPLAGGLVTAVDIGIAVLAGFLVLPAMYVALNSGVTIFAADGSLLSEDTLIFTVLPELFLTMGAAGNFISFLFFFLMSIAALTSSISMLEVPVAYTIERHGVGRHRAVVLIGAAITGVSLLILFNFSTLFGFVITLTTRYSQPLLGFVFCIYVGWIWHRNSLLDELRKGSPEITGTWFWKIWPWHLRIVCPAIILLIFAQSIA